MESGLRVVHTGRLPGNRQEDKGGIKRRRAKCLKDSMTAALLTFALYHFLESQETTNKHMK